jgi:hypothetical protein
VESSCEFGIEPSGCWWESHREEGHYSPCHSPNPHTNLLNVFIQIANNKGILFKKKMAEQLDGWILMQYAETGT